MNLAMSMLFKSYWLEPIKICLLSFLTTKYYEFTEGKDPKLDGPSAQRPSLNCLESFYSSLLLTKHELQISRDLITSLISEFAQVVQKPPSNCRSQKFRETNRCVFSKYKPAIKCDYELRVQVYPISSLEGLVHSVFIWVTKVNHWYWHILDHWGGCIMRFPCDFIGLIGICVSDFFVVVVGSILMILS